MSLGAVRDGKDARLHHRVEFSADADWRPAVYSVKDILRRDSIHLLAVEHVGLQRDVDGFVVLSVVPVIGTAYGQSVFGWELTEVHPWGADNVPGVLAGLGLVMELGTHLAGAALKPVVSGSVQDLRFGGTIDLERSLGLVLSVAVCLIDQPSFVFVIRTEVAAEVGGLLVSGVWFAFEVSRPWFERRDIGKPDRCVRVAGVVIGVLPRSYVSYRSKKKNDKVVHAVGEKSARGRVAVRVCELVSWR